MRILSLLQQKYQKYCIFRAKSYGKNLNYLKKELRNSMMEVPDWNRRRRRHLHQKETFNLRF